MVSPEDLKKLTTEELIEKVLQYKNEFDEFRTDSRELEKMLESELEESQRKLKDKERSLQLAQLELDRLKERTSAEKVETVRTEEILKKELKKVTEERDIGKARIRTLEQRNDDLERAVRYNQQEMEDLVIKLNQAMERTSLLENEVADKQAANEEMYRLREELKERPKLVVGPLRIEKTDETPDEPTPEKIRNNFEERGDTLALTAETSFTKDHKTFVGNVNQIVRELMVKVESLEFYFMSRNKKSPRA